MKKAAQRVVETTKPIKWRWIYNGWELNNGESSQKKNDYTKLWNEMNKSNNKKMILGDTYHFKKKLILRVHKNIK